MQVKVQWSVYQVLTSIYGCEDCQNIRPIDKLVRNRGLSSHDVLPSSHIPRRSGWTRPSPEVRHSDPTLHCTSCQPTSLRLHHMRPVHTIFVFITPARHAHRWHPISPPPSFDIGWKETLREANHTKYNRDLDPQVARVCNFKIIIHRLKLWTGSDWMLRWLWLRMDCIVFAKYWLSVYGDWTFLRIAKYLQKTSAFVHSL